MRFKTLLEKIAKKQGISVAHVEDSSESTKGHGYIGDVSSAHIKGKDKNGKEIALNLIIKSVSTNEDLCEVAGLSQVFNREIYMYSMVFPAFYTFIKKKRLVDFRISVPRCYEVSIIKKQEALVFEDLKDYNFRIWERALEMEDEHVKLILAEYGRFHALSFAIQDQEPKLFQKLSENFDNMYDIFLAKTGFFNSFINMANKAQFSLDSKTDESILNVYKKFLHDVNGTFKRLLTSTEKHQVFLHADCWSNNMMFQYNDINNPGKPSAMRFLDFQMSRIGSPVCDLVYFFYVCSSKEVLENLNVYMTVYYNSMSTTLKRLGSDPEQLFPFSVFKQHWEKYAKLGLIKASFFKYLLLTNDDELVTFSEIVDSGQSLSDGFDYEIANIQKYNERIRNVILHCVKNNFI